MIAQPLIVPFEIDLDLPPAERAHFDLIALCLDAHARLGGDEDVVFFNQPAHPRHGLRLQPPGMGLRVDPRVFPAQGLVQLLLSATPAAKLEALSRVPLRLRAPGVDYRWTMEGGASVLELGSLSLEPGGGVVVRSARVAHRRPLAAVLTDFGAQVGEDTGADALPCPDGPVALPAVARELRIRARFTAPASHAQLLTPGLAAVFMAAHDLAGICWPWDRLLWRLPHTPVRWCWTAGWQELTVAVDHLATLQRLLVFLHTPHEPQALEAWTDRCELLIDDQPRYRLTVPGGKGRVALLARLERLRDDWRLMPDPLLTANLANLARQRGLPLALGQG